MNRFCSNCGCELPHPNEMGLTTKEADARPWLKLCPVCQDLKLVDPQDIEDAFHEMEEITYRDVMESKGESICDNCLADSGCCPGTKECEKYKDFYKGE